MEVDDVMSVMVSLASSSRILRSKRPAPDSSTGAGGPLARTLDRAYVEKMVAQGAIALAAPPMSQVVFSEAVSEQTLANEGVQVGKNRIVLQMGNTLQPLVDIGTPLGKFVGEHLTLAGSGGRKVGRYMMPINLGGFGKKAYHADEVAPRSEDLPKDAPYGRLIFVYAAEGDSDIGQVFRANGDPSTDVVNLAGRGVGFYYGYELLAHNPNVWHAHFNKGEFGAGGGVRAPRATVSVARALNHHPAHLHPPSTLTRRREEHRVRGGGHGRRALHPRDARGPRGGGRAPAAAHGLA